MTLNARTIHYNDWLLKMALKEPFSTLENTTLNEKFGVNIVTTVLPENEYPTMKYFAIGNGNPAAVLTETEAVMHRNNHNATHGALFNHIPFLAREEGNDISSTERENYRLRVVQDIDGTNYIFYYLKALDTSQITTNYLELSYGAGGVVEINTYEPDPADLSPTHHEAGGDVSTEASTSVVISKKLPFVLTASDLAEIQNAVTILYGATPPSPEDYAINELAVCTGYDSDGIDGLDAIYVQVAFFVDIDYNIETMVANGEEINREIEVAGVDRLVQYTVEDETVVTAG